MRMKKIIFCLFLMTYCFRTEGKSHWNDAVEDFVEKNVKTLRDSRPQLKRPHFSFGEAIKILDFVEDSKSKYGTVEVASSSNLADLIIDVCDVVNAQRPDFKSRYDIFVEQWDGNAQVPFSLFSFDRIAQVFHYRGELFDMSEGFAYRRMIEHIVQHELPILKRVFRLIFDLDAIRQGTPFQGLVTVLDEDSLKDMNLLLDQAAVLSGKAKAKIQKALREKVPSPRIKVLCALSSMAHDYLTLGRIEEALKVALAIPKFEDAEQREAFLAGIIQIGELATNRNLSHFVRQFMPTIPWEGLVHCRDAIEHQDEHGFDTYFDGLVSGSNVNIDFKKWKKDLKILAQRVSKAKLDIWTDNIKNVFEIWIEAELSGVPIYGVTSKKHQSPPVAKETKKVFRQTPLFKGDKETWGKLINGNTRITYEHLAALQQHTSDLNAFIVTLTDSKDRTFQLKFLTSYEKIKSYLWNRINDESTHLSDGEKTILIQVVQDHFHNPAIARLCLALLNMDQPYLTTEHNNQFAEASNIYGLDFRPIYAIIMRFKPEMVITRQVCSQLPFDNSKDLVQSKRNELAKLMFVRTTKHLHNLAHGPNFMARLMQEAMTIPVRFAFEKASEKDPKIKGLELKIAQLHETHAISDAYGYSNLTPEGMDLLKKEVKKSGLKLDHPKQTRELKQFSEGVIDRFVRKAHRVFLPEAIKRNPTTYLASVYTLSVGISALKEWILRESVPPQTELEEFEKLRDGRNFIAHGDILRSMNKIDLGDIQENLLTDHLEHCSKLKFYE